MAKTKPSERAPKIPATINPDGVKPVYVNNMELQMNALEARLSFNEIIPGPEGLTVERRASLVMSVGHFLALAQVLAKNVPAALEASKKMAAELAPAKDGTKE
jgi:hypothetical protein